MKYRLLHSYISLARASALILQLASLFFATTDARSATGPAMPEFYAALPNQYCSIQFRDHNADFSKRRDDMFQLLPKLYKNSSGWKKGYVVVGVDYLNFDSLDLITFTPCKDWHGVAKAISDVKAIGKAYTNTIVGRLDIVSSLALLNSIPSPVGRFRHFNPYAELTRCVFLLQTIPPGNFSFARVTDSAVTQVWLEFRFPFSDVGGTNDKIFVLMSRDCDKKKEIFSELRYAILLSGIDISKFVRFDPSPDVSDYIRVQPQPVR